MKYEIVYVCEVTFVNDTSAEAAINFLHDTKTIKHNLIITGYSTCFCDFAVVLLKNGSEAIILIPHSV